MCKFCNEGISLLKDDGWEVWIEYHNRLQIDDETGDRTTYIDIEYCPMCGRRLQ